MRRSALPLSGLAFLVPTGALEHIMRLRPVLGALSIIGTVMLTLSVTGVATANPPSSKVPDDQPLPPYTISNPPMPPILSNGVLTTVLQGVRDHAAYKIEIPAKWNGNLVMWDHGFRGQGTLLTVDPPTTGSFNLRQRFVDEGYAWAASSYAGNGYDIRTGVLTTKDLADAFPTLTGKHPNEIFIAGVSMGGHIIGRSIEQYPHFYAGALPMCGVLGDQDLFDFYLNYNVVAQDLAGVPQTFPVPANYVKATVPGIEAALGLTALSQKTPDPTTAAGTQFRSIVINLTGGPRPGADASFVIWKDFLFNIAVPTSTGTTLAQNPGQIATNLSTQFTPNSPANVNATVLRIAPQNIPARQEASLTEIPKISGKTFTPVLTLHGLGDMFVPFFNEQDFKLDADRSGSGDLVVQRAIRTSGHCEFSTTETGTAWDDLVNWVDHGKKPAGDDVLEPKAVAEPTFGCQFSDKAVSTGSRLLYTACP
jgi:hypothetical protein